jgi:uncharacterized protein YecT (DUF1311 family)
LIVSLLLGVAAAAAAPQSDPCSGSSTYDMNQCLVGKVEKAGTRLNEYVAAAKKRYEDEPAVVLGIGASQTAFEAYRDTECAAVLEAWTDGTIRGAMTLGCKLSLTNERTHTVWANWLQYMDSTPAVLPEPRPIE